MRSGSYILACVLLAFSAGAFAATAADARVQVQRAREGSQGLRFQQSQLRSELNEVAGRIEELKAQQRGRLLPGSELSGLLRRSQELSGSLTAVEAALARADAEVQQRSAALADALDGELEAARTSFDRVPRGERRALLDRMRALQRERDQLRSQLPASRFPRMKPQDSDNPTDLLEQADALRDTQDKVAARLKALDRRIAELKRERELDRRMGEFLGDEQAFDERDRRLVGSGSTVPPPPDPRGPVVFSAQSAPDGPDTSGTSTRAGSARDGQPEVRIGSGLAPGSDEDLAALARQRRELEAMSKELGARAGELERRARELK